MFNSIIRYFNQNRKRIIFAVIIIIAIILLIQVLNYFSARALEEEGNSILSNVTSQESSKSPNVIHTESILSDREISEENAQENQNLINNFIQACNNGNIEQAYNYLSTSCKQELFPSINEFKSKYYDKIFTSAKEYSIENWITSDSVYTYRITYVNNILASGTLSDNIEDYISVVIENGNKKLNIFRYIMNQAINRSAENDIVKIEVLDKDVYDDYEVYNIKATNKSQNTIMLNRSEDNDGIYVQYNGRDDKYTAFITEIYEQNLVLQRNQEKYLSIKINKVYNGATQLKNMVFSDIINNKDTFDQTTNKNNYSDISTIEINLL